MLTFIAATKPIVAPGAAEPYLWALMLAALVGANAYAVATREAPWRAWSHPHVVATYDFIEHEHLLERGLPPIRPARDAGGAGRAALGAYDDPLRHGRRSGGRPGKPGSALHVITATPPPLPAAGAGSA